MLRLLSFVAALFMALAPVKVDALSTQQKLLMAFGPASSVSFNITPANMAHFTAMWKAQARNTIVAYMGDSTTRGVNQNAVPFNSQYPNAMPMQVAALLNAAGVPSGANNWYGLSGSNLADYVTRDSRITTGGTAAVGGTVVQGGAGMSMSSATAVMTFTTTANVTTADIYTLDSPSFVGASLSWKVDGGATTNITQSGLNAFRKTTIALGAAGIHTIEIDWVSGSNALYGIDAYNATSGRIEMTQRQWGTSGATAGTMVLNTGAPAAGSLQQIADFPPDLVICECGLVNSWRTGQSIASVATNLTTLVQAVQATGSNFLFMTPPYDDSLSTAAAQSQNAYVQTMFQVALALNVGVINTRAAGCWTSWATAVAQGCQSANDAVHPALVGYINQAHIIANILLAYM